LCQPLPLSQVVLALCVVTHSYQNSRSYQQCHFITAPKRIMTIQGCAFDGQLLTAYGQIGQRDSCACSKECVVILRLPLQTMFPLRGATRCGKPHDGPYSWAMPGRLSQRAWLFLELVKGTHLNSLVTATILPHNKGVQSSWQSYTHACEGVRWSTWDVDFISIPDT
jgi:hypothetical protein